MLHIGQDNLEEENVTADSELAGLSFVFFFPVKEAGAC